ncbi:S8/S53 family peptidase [Nostocoides veronense]|uniref:Peptidase S8/S53 domain-containing protein n=1 Tax=Nostocoides veronense TaxID=330836 RepID=A0ABN2LLB0_9MICO
MAQQPPSDDDTARGAVWDRSRRLAAQNPKLTLEFLRRYERFIERLHEIDSAGPQGPIDLVRNAQRLIVRGRLQVLTEQEDRVLPKLADAGWSVDDIERDERIGVSLLRGTGLAAEPLYTLVRTLVADMPLGQAPLSIGFDDVTYEAIVFKPIKPQGASGEADRTTYSSSRPTGTGRGAGVVIGVIDGGFESTGAPARTDGWFDNVTPPQGGAPKLNQADESTLDPGAGHGTFVTGIVASHAPDATIRQYRALDSWGLGGAWRLKDMILQAVDDGCQVINISLGFEDPDLLGSPALSAVLHHIPNHVVVVAAAGNSGTTVPMLPAAHKMVIAVGGLEVDLDPVGWSNRGPWVDFSALAVPVLSTYVMDPTDPNGDPNPWAIWAGTSFAAPKVAGELAVLLGTGLTPVEAVDVLRTRAEGRLPNPDFGFLLALPDQFPRTDPPVVDPPPGRVFRIPPVVELPDLTKLRLNPWIFRQR